MKDRVLERVRKFAFEKVDKKSFFRKNEISEKAVEMVMLFINDEGQYDDSIEYEDSFIRPAWILILKDLGMDHRDIQLNHQIFKSIKSKAQKLLLAISGQTYSLDYVPSKRCYKLMSPSAFTSDAISVVNKSMGQTLGTNKSCLNRVMRFIQAMKRSSRRVVKEKAAHWEKQLKSGDLNSIQEIKTTLSGLKEYTNQNNTRSAVRIARR